MSIVAARTGVPLARLRGVRIGGTWQVGGYFLLLTAVILIAPAVVPHDALAAPGVPLVRPGFEYPFGTDIVGRDMLSRVVTGARSTWLSAWAVIAFGAVTGVVVGLLAALCGGVVDRLLMRLTDGCLAIPAPIIAIAIAASIGASLSHTLISLSIVWWPYYARIVRGEAVALLRRPFIESARLSGAGLFRIGGLHVFPGIVPALVVAMSLDVGALIVTLAGLSFLGLGAPAPTPELGAMIAQGLSYLTSAWWVPVLPGVAILLLAFGSNVLGDSLSAVYGRRV